MVKHQSAFFVKHEELGCLVNTSTSHCCKQPRHNQHRLVSINKYLLSKSVYIFFVVSNFACFLTQYQLRLLHLQCFLTQTTSTKLKHYDEYMEVQLNPPVPSGDIHFLFAETPKQIILTAIYRHISVLCLLHLQFCTPIKHITKTGTHLEPIT